MNVVKLPTLPSPRQNIASHPGALPSSTTSSNAIHSARQTVNSNTNSSLRYDAAHPPPQAAAAGSLNSPPPPPRRINFGASSSTQQQQVVVPPLPLSTALVPTTATEGGGMLSPSTTISPRTLGSKVAQPLATAVQKRIRMLDNHVAQKHVNPIAAWPSTSSQLQSTRGGGGALVPSNGTVSVFGAGGGANRAPLSIELENFIRREHRDLIATKPYATELDSLPIYREAFGCLISHFPEYSATLSLIKAQYDATVEELSFAAQRAVKLDMDNRSMKATLNLQFVEERESMSSCLHETQSQLQAALKVNQQQRQQIMKLEHDFVTLQQAHVQRDKLFEESQERIKMLGITLVEEGTKMSQVVRENHMANNEVHRLQVLTDSLRLSLGEAEKIIQVFRNSDVGTANAAAASGAGAGGGNISSPPSRARKSLAPSTNDHHARSPSMAPSQPQQAPMTPTPRANAAAASGGGGGGGMLDRRGTLSNADRDELKRRVFELECSLESLQHENNQLVKENKRLNFRIARLQTETQRDVLTPRPDWSAVAQRLPGFHAEKNRSSVQQINEVVNFVQNRLRSELLENERQGYGETVWRWLEEEGMAESELLHRLRYFIPRGTASTVPVYLRTARPVRNRRFNKGDVEAILHQFWAARQVRRRSVPYPTVEEYWGEWSLKETGSQAAAVELAYNILDVCERSQHDPDCRLFLKVMRGEIAEFAVYDQSDCIDALTAACGREKIEGTNSMITRASFLRACREVFPEKPRDHMTKLRFILAMWTGDAVFDYELLFQEDGDGNQTPFVEMLRRQHAFEVEAFTVDVCETIRAIANPDTGMVNVADAMNAIHELDPYLTEVSIQNFFSIGCRITITDLLAAPRTLETQMEPLVQRLKFHTLLKRMSPPREAGEDGEDDDGEIDSSAWQSRADALLEKEH